jgi:uncharacterized protein (TIGR02145 family)
MQTSLKNLVLILAGMFLIGSCTNNGSGKKGKVSDVDGNVYETVTIGAQNWMAENLKTTKYNDGSLIPNVTDSAWKSLKAGAYCWYGNDSAANKKNYGAFYNWFAVSTAKLCPAGWHVPSDKEWRALTDFMGGETVAGKDMKATSGWSKGGNGLNTYGFTGLPAGYRSFKGTFGSHYSGGYWWSTTTSADNAWYCVMFSNENTANKFYSHKESGFSVRCVENAVQPK